MKSSWSVFCLRYRCQIQLPELPDDFQGHASFACRKISYSTIRRKSTSSNGTSFSPRNQQNTANSIAQRIAILLLNLRERDRQERTKFLCEKRVDRTGGHKGYTKYPEERPHYIPLCPLTTGSFQNNAISVHRRRSTSKTSITSPRWIPPKHFCLPPRTKDYCHGCCTLRGI